MFEWTTNEGKERKGGRVQLRLGFDMFHEIGPERSREILEKMGRLRARVATTQHVGHSVC